MASCDASRRRVSYNQLVILCEFLTDNRDIATGYNKTARARDRSKKIWQQITESLNADGDGAVKDWKAWSKYWNDYKSKLKKTVATIRASLQRTGGGPSDVRDLTEIEQRFLQVLGESFGSGLPGARIEPFDQVLGSEELRENNLGRSIILEYEVSPQPGPPGSHLPLSPQPGPSGLQLSRSPQPGPSGLQLSRSRSPQPGPSRLQLSRSPQPGPSGLQLSRSRSPQPGPSRLQLSRSPQPGPSGLQFFPRPTATTAHQTRRERTPPQPPSAHSTPRRSPRRRRQNQAAQPNLNNQRRRQRRRELPMSQEEARRNLIAISNTRSEQELVRNEILQNLVQELREIKELLRTRLPVPELGETPNMNLP